MEKLQHGQAPVTAHRHERRGKIEGIVGDRRQGCGKLIALREGSQQVRGHPRQVALLPEVLRLETGPGPRHIQAAIGRQPL